MNQENLLDRFMYEVFSDNPQNRLEYYSKLNNYLINQKKSNLKCYDLIKFFEATLMFLQSDKASEDIDGLIIVQIFIERMTHYMQFHLTECILRFKYYITYILHYF